MQKAPESSARTGRIRQWPVRATMNVTGGTGTMRRTWLISLLPLLLVVGGRAPETETSQTTLPAPTDTASAAPAAAPEPVRKAPVREGGTLVRAAEGDALFVADEDHGAVRVVPLP